VKKKHASALLDPPFSSSIVCPRTLRVCDGRAFDNADDGLGQPLESSGTRAEGGRIFLTVDLPRQYDCLMAQSPVAGCRSLDVLTLVLRGRVHGHTGFAYSVDLAVYDEVVQCTSSRTLSWALPTHAAE